MMYRCRRLFSGLVFVALFMALSMPVSASQQINLPEGEILITYSDGAKEDTYDSVLEIVQILTWQGFSVVYAPVSDCIGNFREYKSIIFYQVEEYPEELISEIHSMELQNALAGGNTRKFMFLGDGLLRDYLNETGRSGAYEESSDTVAELEYDFQSHLCMETLIYGEGFLFLKEPSVQAGKVETDRISGYFSAGSGVFSHMHAVDFSDPVVKAAFTRELARWQWDGPGEPEVYAQYIVIDKVYPFTDPDRLLQVVKQIAAKKEPFIISVMPVTVHGDYPAMQHFCEVLRYAQDQGGAVILHSPINQMAEFDVDKMNEAVTRAVSVYISHGVYPMGLEVPNNWIFNEDAAEVMSHFKTILISAESDGHVEIDRSLRTNSVYRDGHQWIAPAIPLDGSGTSYINVHSTAVNFDLSWDMDRIKTALDDCRKSFVPLKSLWHAENSFWTNEDVMSYQNHRIIINGSQVHTEFVPAEYEEKYAYNRNTLTRFSKDLTQENQKLIIAVIGISLLFLLFIYLARRSNKGRFFIEEEDVDEYWENKK